MWPPICVQTLQKIERLEVKQYLIKKSPANEYRIQKKQDIELELDLKKRC